VSKEVSGGQGELRAPEWWPESSGRGLDDDFLIEAFFLSSLIVFSASLAFPSGSRRSEAASKEVLGGQGKSRAPERWPESSGTGLDDDFLI